MLLRDLDLHKYCGDAQCPTCLTHYDPTYGGCPKCTKQRAIVPIAVATVALLSLLFWLPLEAGQAKAQAETPTCWVEPDGTEICISSIHSTLTPFVPTETPEDTPAAPTPTNTRRPLVTVTPTMTPTPVAISPVPWCTAAPCVYLPVVSK